jgi:hypothetical protein
MPSPDGHWHLDWQANMKQTALAGYMMLTPNKDLNLNRTHNFMSRTLYSPKLSDDVVRALYREGLRRRQPMTVVADNLLRQSLGRTANDPPLFRVCEDPTPYGATISNPDAA